MHIHILGICGTFMGGLALIARAAGHKVTGCDVAVYPPMSTQLEEQGIELIEGYDAEQIELKPDLFIIGNVVTRGNPLMEEILNRDLPYTSGPQWLGEQVLRGQHVLAVAGTHGKTTTSSMLAWILQFAGLEPNFLIGGIADNFGISARFDKNKKYFVIEADEYDTAFFDKRSKFVHYRPRTAILNNLEFDHADIFDNLADIQRQFHHLVRIVPQTGRVIYPAAENALQEVIELGCWTEQTRLGNGSTTVSKDSSWDYRLIEESGSHFAVSLHGQEVGEVQWSLIGVHNVANALAAISAAEHIGVKPSVACEALQSFEGIKRRMELRDTINNIAVYDDFAHHPTAISTTLSGLRKQVGDARIVAILEPRSNTMKLGTMSARLPESLKLADVVFCYNETQGKHSIQWDAEGVFADMPQPTQVHDDLEQLLQAATKVAQPGDHIVIMSNGGFGGFHNKLISNLNKKYA
ncbi:MAG: UDP-N-acetylmuramate:L-alanyl-gamma-D-glutamyl-meso-diaminopimelate ligase [Alcaligenaceae bacterium]|jgi:UDP-N-acetylmuramate: L-alanyl-gamma-D-glutamyl-meso-diaminopimelate ligase|nr:UDP-N-acetylmuramate:L-alanyl-gamma-D-glutamyl-meso-diaminopimelate ligase [Alcaligenaceae bacterium]